MSLASALMRDPAAFAQAVGFDPQPYRLALMRALAGREEAVRTLWDAQRGRFRSEAVTLQRFEALDSAPRLTLIAAAARVQARPQQQVDRVLGRLARRQDALAELVQDVSGGQA